MDALILREILNKAVAGDPHYRYMVGRLYYDGYEIEENLEEALTWFQLAADGGHTLAQFALAHILYHGEGVVQDDLEALYWYEQAAKGGHAYAKCMINSIKEKQEMGKIVETKSHLVASPPSLMNQPKVNQKEKGV